MVFELIGVLGIALSAAAYVPQAVHIAREHCAAGISIRAWTMWLASGVLVGAVAVHRGDADFILLQVTSLSSAILILFLARKYRGSSCEEHSQLPSGPAAVIAPTVTQR